MFNEIRSPLAVEDTKKTIIRLANATHGINSVREASPLFVSLVDLVKNRVELNNDTTANMGKFFRQISPGSKRGFSSSQILLSLVPVEVGDCSGFTESILTLLTSRNDDILVMTMQFVGETVRCSDFYLRRDLINSGFFSSLSPSFQQSPFHFETDHTYSLLEIIHRCVLTIRDNVKALSRRLKTNEDDIRQTMLEMMIAPLTPFWQSLHHYRHRMEEINLTLSTPWSPCRLLQIGLLHTPTLHFVFSLRVGITITTCVSFMEVWKHRCQMLSELKAMMTTLKSDQSEIKQRRKAIICELREQGFADELEQLKPTPLRTQYPLKCSEIVGRVLVGMGANFRLHR
ncbi:hypothetical protein BLNAU_6094 [Blattamonas nauphoetae]|uniref:Uncharacterized protein n=1 Tax=Blattamonas nauphoetae TaxID=2049346 RepID=A0ABQ9Y522_9EUKA|nr:hypothetical protein BLNAU_6094 [Blattamonas nauphoetae]